MKSHATFILFLFACSSFAQSPDFFLKQLQDNSNQQVLTRMNAFDSANKLDTVQLLKLTAALEKEVSSASPKIKIRAAAFTARVLFYQFGPGDSLYAARMKTALFDAYEADESFMVAEYGRWYSEMLNSMGKKNEAVQYALNAIVLQEQLGLAFFPTVNTFYLTIGELFFRTRNYADALKWLNKGLALQGKDKLLPPNFANGLNNVALSQFQLKNFRECLILHQQCMAYSLENNLQDWFAISKYNQINPYTELGLYDSALLLLEEVYAIGIKDKDDYLLAGASYQMGTVANRKKDFTRALNMLQQAEAYADKTGIKAYRTKICKELATAYEALGQPHQSLAYFKEYKYLDDSAARTEATVKSEYLLAKANYEKEQLGFRKLKNKKEASIRLRNAGILALLVISAGALLWLNRKRKLANQNREEAERQLQQFTNRIREKEQELEKLQQTLEQAQPAANTGMAAEAEALSQQMILTEEDWQSFQALFTKTYPGFLFRLREKFSGITEAEIRMACLIKIRLTTKQIAQMQGISPDSVHKTRHRLRQRFATATTAELESIIDGL